MECKQVLIFFFDVIKSDGRLAGATINLTMDRVAIVGHSFISRLHSALRNNVNFPDSFNIAGCDIRCYGRSGGTVNSLSNDIGLTQFLILFQPRVVILQIGGNDLSSVAPETLAYRIVDFTSYLKDNFNVQQVYVCELFRRLSPRFISPNEYEHNRQVVNNMLKTIFEDSSDLHFWKHLRLMYSPFNIFNDDGVHLSMIGLQKFYRSLRLAILHAL